MNTQGFTPAELAALAEKGFPAENTVLMETKCLQVQVVGQTRDPQTGADMLLFAFIAPIPANLLRPKPVILDASGQPIAGGLPSAMPIPPIVRVLLQQDAMNAAFVPVRPCGDKGVERDTDLPVACGLPTGHAGWHEDKSRGRTCTWPA